MSSKQNTSIGGSSLLLGDTSGQDDYNIIGTNGRSIKINGVVPSSGGGVIPPVGDIDFIGNLNCNDQPGGGSKGIITAEKKVVAGLGGLETTGGINILTNGNLTLVGNGNINQQGLGKITSGSAGIESKGDIKTIGSFDLEIGKDIYFDGTDIYHRTNNPSAQESYKDFKQLISEIDNNTFTGTNIFRNHAVSIQALNNAVPAVYVNTITLNTDGNINCNEINNNTLLKSNSIICENGSNESQLVKARQYHFRPDSLESTGWVFSQKPPDNPALPEDNYLMLQNTQATGSLNLVKSSFDPQNPTPFDIILDPQNGQVKTTTSFDAPKVNFRKNVVNNWSIYQPPSGDANENKLRIQNYQDNAGGVQILDNSNNVWVEFTNLFNTFNKPTFINNVLTMVGNAVINNSYSLLFGSYIFKPIEITYAFTGAKVSDAPGTLFNSLTTSFTRTNDGDTNVKLNDLGEGIYILSIDATSSSGGLIGSSRFMCNFPYMVSANAAGSSSFDGNFCMNTTPPGPPNNLPFVEPTIEADGTNGPVGSTNYAFVFSSVASGLQTYNGTVKITRLSY